MLFKVYKGELCRVYMHVYCLRCTRENCVEFICMLLFKVYKGELCRVYIHVYCLRCTRENCVESIYMLLFKVYKGELNLEDGENFHDRPPLELVIKKFRAAKLTSIFAAIAFTLIFVFLWPGSMLR